MLTRIALSVIALATAGVLATCDCESCKTPPAQSTGTSPQTTPSVKPDATYTVRGKVLELPDPSNPMSDFTVRHEAIDNFKNDKGEVVGMGTMPMVFPLAKGVSLESLKVDDIIEMTFEDYYQPVRRYQVVSIKKLPPETVLEFRAAKPSK